MSTAKHRPGPWQVAPNNAVVANSSGGHGIVLVAYTGTSDADRVNARLIAAAPDLLAACQEHLLGNDWDKAKAMMKAAIRKATEG